LGRQNFSYNANDKLFARNIVQNDKARALQSFSQIAEEAILGLSLSSPNGHQQAY
jgi:hypothetical protein